MFECTVVNLGQVAASVGFPHDEAPGAESWQASSSLNLAWQKSLHLNSGMGCQQALQHIFWKKNLETYCNPVWRALRSSKTPRAKTILRHLERHVLNLNYISKLPQNLAFKQNKSGSW